MLKPEDWKELAKSIRDGQCTPFLGAGACVPTLPTGSELSHALAREFDFPLDSAADLSHVTQFIAIKSGDVIRPNRKFSSALPPAAILDLPAPSRITCSLPGRCRSI